MRPYHPVDASMSDFVSRLPDAMLLRQAAEVPTNWQECDWRSAVIAEAKYRGLL